MYCCILIYGSNCSLIHYFPSMGLVWNIKTDKANKLLSIIETTIPKQLRIDPKK